MQYTAGEAAKATGKNIATITRAIKSGKISASKDSAGAWRIDPAELHRVFPVLAQDLQNSEMRGDATSLQEQGSRSDKALMAELAIMRERLQSQDQLLADRADQIADLRSRLDREGEERRKLTAILTDQRPLHAATPTVENATLLPRRSWWPWKR